MLNNLRMENKSLGYYMIDMNLTISEWFKSLNLTDDDVSEFEDTVGNILIAFFYSLIIIVSLIGNSLVCKIIFTNKKFRNTTNILIASLAISDILMTAINIPFFVARVLLSNWPFGRELCFIVPFIQVTCVYVSTFSIITIAIYRYYVMKNNNKSLSLSNVWLAFIIILTWFLSAVFALPHSMFNEVVNIFTYRPLTRCRAVYPTTEFNIPLILSIEAFLTQYLLPLSISCMFNYG